MELTVKPEFAVRVISGLCVGDSLGSTSEFQIPKNVPENCIKDGWPLKQVGGGVLHWKQGAPTDDSDMAICVLRSFCSSGNHFDFENVMDQVGVACFYYTSLTFGLVCHVES